MNSIEAPYKFFCRVCGRKFKGKPGLWKHLAKRTDNLHRQVYMTKEEIVSFLDGAIRMIAAVSEFVKRPEIRLLNSFHK